MENRLFTMKKKTKKINCKLCDIKFSNVGNLEQHMNHIHKFFSKGREI